MSRPMKYNGVSCGREGCNWSGKTVGDYERHVEESHE